MSTKTINEEEQLEEIINVDDESINKLLNYINSSIDFTKNCIKDNLDRDIDTTNLNSQLKIYKRIKDKILYYFNLEENNIHNLNVDIKDEDLPF